MLELRRDDLQLFFVSILYCYIYIYINDSKNDPKLHSKTDSKKDSRLLSMFYMPTEHGIEKTAQPCYKAEKRSVRTYF